MILAKFISLKFKMSNLQSAFSNKFYGISAAIQRQAHLSNVSKAIGFKMQSITLTMLNCFKFLVFFIFIFECKLTFEPSVPLIHLLQSNVVRNVSHFPPGVYVVATNNGFSLARVGIFVFFGLSQIVYAGCMCAKHLSIHIASDWSIFPKG